MPGLPGVIDQERGDSARRSSDNTRIPVKELLTDYIKERDRKDAGKAGKKRG